MSAISFSRLATISRSQARIDAPYWLALVAAFALGFAFRIVPAIAANFPLHDGGMFFVMIEDIRHSIYVMPAFISFNGSQIPFAYPPLAFYAAAAIADVTRLPALDVLRVLPSAVAGGVLVAFFVLARSMLGSKAAVMVAVLAFAALPSSFSYLIVGAGLAKSFGLLFALLALACAYQAYRRPSRATAAVVAVLGALALLSHIEMAWFLAFSVGALCVAFGRSRNGLGTSALVALGVLGLTAPWWALVAYRHGLSPFLAASQVGSTLSGAGDAGWIGLAVGLAVLVACVIMLVVPDRRLALLGWLGLIVVLDTRNFAWLPTVPLALALGAIVGEGLIPRLFRQPGATSSSGEPPATRRFSSVLDRLANAAMINVVIIPLVAMNLGNSTLDNFGNINLSPDDRAAMQWAGRETPASSKFLVLSGLRQWSADSISEWFPALSERVSVVTPQGSEWLPGGEFGRRLEAHASAQACLTADAACLDAWSAANHVAFSHVYVVKRPGRVCCPALSDALRVDPAYEQIYDGPAATIFVRAGSP